MQVLCFCMKCIISYIQFKYNNDRPIKILYFITTAVSRVIKLQCHKSVSFVSAMCNLHDWQNLLIHKELGTSI